MLDEIIELMLIFLRCDNVEDFLRRCILKCLGVKYPHISVLLLKGSAKSKRERVCVCMCVHACMHASVGMCIGVGEGRIGPGDQKGVCCLVQVGGDGGLNSSGCHGNRKLDGSQRDHLRGPGSGWIWDQSRTGWHPGVGQRPRLPCR